MSTALVVERDRATRRVLASELHSAGFSVREACDAESGLAAALYDEPDLVLVDCGARKLNGVELCRQLRRFGLSRTSVVMLTRSQRQTAEGMAAGADRCWITPLRRSELAIRARALLPQRAAPR